VDSYFHVLDKFSAAKILIMTEDADNLLRLVSQELTPGDFTVIRGSPDPFFVEFLRPEVTKGAGLALLCENIGISMSEVVAFGDGDNDKEMLQLAGQGIAMGNAKSAAKEVANVVIPHTNDEEGVARYLELLIEQRIIADR